MTIIISSPFFEKTSISVSEFRNLFIGQELTDQILFLSRIQISNSCQQFDNILLSLDVFLQSFFQPPQMKISRPTDNQDAGTKKWSPSDPKDNLDVKVSLDTFLHDCKPDWLQNCDCKGTIESNWFKDIMVIFREANWWLMIDNFGETMLAKDTN